MKNNIFEKILILVSGIGASAGDSEELKLQKSLLVLCAFPFVFSGIIWGSMYMWFGERRAAMIPLSYSVFSLISIIYFGYTRKFGVFRFSQILLILLLPFLLMIELGGFINGSAVILWGLISPLGAMLFDKQSNSQRWLFAFLCLVAVAGILQPWLRTENKLTREQISLLFTINLLGAGALIFVMFYYFVGKKNFFQARSESLLLNILPKEISEELKTKGRAEARYFSAVTVMFTDFKNFTRISELLSPAELVAEIDTCFKAFDNIIIKHNIEKIKTIGDSYMCAGGLPVANGTHAMDVVCAGLEIKQYINVYSEERMKAGKEPFEIRIGIHSGPVVAGIVGFKKFAYDIWGDTVNIASRMESSGEAGKVNISGSTYEMVKNSFQFTYRNKIPAKNKGEIDMYFVESKL